MGLAWKEEHLDYVLVPSGLLIMLGYHLFHLSKCLNNPETTVIGYENYNRRAWVARILQLEAKERGQAITVISTNLSAATSLASISLGLSSLIGAWIGSSYHNDYVTKSIYGNTSATVVYIKYIALLACFMVAFACFVQTIRCFVHANFLISMPNCEMPVKTVESAVIKGSNFWVVVFRQECKSVANYNPPASYDSSSKKIDNVEMAAVAGNHEESQRSPNGALSLKR
ncbi:hypothetical protein DH2020_031575 [Rehmannia glutinosa]|uniref:Uncharacterized protein n=1 Tax=Rehmannia glutinosa TaxID=99300 RepID=A0ABR0VLJ7_REHGL